LLTSGRLLSLTNAFTRRLLSVTLLDSSAPDFLRWEGTVQLCLVTRSSACWHRHPRVRAPRDTLGRHSSKLACAAGVLPVHVLSHKAISFIFLLKEASHSSSRGVHNISTIPQQCRKPSLDYAVLLE
jgi:hypothetical protein